MFKENLKQIRKSLDLTQDDCAKKINVTRQAYSNYETGIREPNISKLIDIANCFEITVDELIGHNALQNNLKKNKEINEEKNVKVYFADEDHIWINGNQFVSLKRFAQVRKDIAIEMNLLNDKNKELSEENEALKILLKNQLMNL